MKIVLVLCATLIGIVFSSSPEEGNLFEGDMELNPEQMAAVLEQQSKNNQFAAIRAGLWPKGRIISYYIDPRIEREYRARKAINDAVIDYHNNNVCIKFNKVSRRPSGPHLFFTTGSGCSSPVGQQRYGNSIKLAPGCWRKGTVMHEIGHSIGLFHEQSRPDRDSYVTINWGNIIDRAKFNFNKLTTSRIDSRGSPYDYDSMMHYGGTFFSKNRGLTIQTKYSRDQSRIGQRSGFSRTDITQIRSMYC